MKRPDLDDNMIAALRPMRAQRPEARFVMLSTANPHRSVLVGLGNGWRVVGSDSGRRSTSSQTLYPQDYLDRERKATRRRSLQAGISRDSCGWSGEPVYLGSVRPRRATASSFQYMEYFQADDYRAGCRSHERSFDRAGRWQDDSLHPERLCSKSSKNCRRGCSEVPGRDRWRGLISLTAPNALIFVDLSFDPTYAEICRGEIWPRAGDWTENHQFRRWHGPVTIGRLKMV